LPGCCGKRWKGKVDEVYVFTDDEYIIDYVYNEYSYLNKVKVINRSSESATDSASTECALKEFTQKIDHAYDILCLIQATSPLTTAQDINNTIDKLIVEHFDSALTMLESQKIYLEQRWLSFKLWL